MQICKQCTNNPTAYARLADPYACAALTASLRSESLFKGWQLFAICTGARRCPGGRSVLCCADSFSARAGLFPPSAGFRPYLQVFLEKNIENFKGASSALPSPKPPPLSV
jgi:hypothetical protein